MDFTRIQTQTDYSEQVFKDGRFDHTRLDASQFHDCTFIRCSFVESVFHNGRFINCTFEQCDLSLVQVPGTLFSATRFEESKLIGIDWTQADWMATRIGNPFSFHKCTLSHSTFIGLSLPKIGIRNCLAANVDFREADLSQADFTGTDLSDSLFVNTNLTQADLSQARNYHIPPQQNILKQAKFSLPEAMSLLYGLDIVLTEIELN